MIVNKRENGWGIIQQPAHALLAMELCTHLKMPGMSRQEVAGILAALALHDDQESYYEKGSYLSKKGAPLDFSLLPMNARARTDQAVRIVHSGFLKSALVGSLILEHFNYLYVGKKIESDMKSALLKGREKREINPKGAPRPKERRELLLGNGILRSPQLNLVQRANPPYAALCGDRNTARHG